MSYTYATVTTLKTGQLFQFHKGATLNSVVLRERNLLVYFNIITRKARRMKVSTDSVRYVKTLDEVFDKYYNDRKEIEYLPF